MGFAVVSCSRNWTAACDAIQSRFDLAAPYLYGTFVVAVVGLVAVLIYTKIVRN